MTGSHNQSHNQMKKMMYEQGNYIASSIILCLLCATIVIAAV